MIQSIKIVRELQGISLEDAKEVVHSSNAWADLRASHDRLHAQAEVAGSVIQPFEPRFDVGDSVEIESLETLERFQEKWKYHHPLTEEQLEFAGRDATVKAVELYYGGDFLYELHGVPGQWHEQSLVAL